MKPQVLMVVILLSASIALLHPEPISVKAASGSPGFVRLFANFNGWNSTVSSNVNPGFTESVGGKFTINIQFDDSAGITHDIAIYTNGTSSGSVSTANSCSTSSMSGCLAKSVPVTSNSLSANLTFTPQPSSATANLGGGGGFEYFCQYHPFSMHGHITVYKDPDITGPNGTPDHIVNILDIATIAFAFGSMALPSPTPTWNAAADLDNNGVVNILDVALAAFYFGQTF
jgi:plastocyanin